MSSPLWVTMARTESLVSASMACTSSKLPPPVGETCETKDCRPLESPAHSSSKIEGGRIPAEPEAAVMELAREIAYKSPLKDFFWESFARIFCRLGQASSIERQSGIIGTGRSEERRV